jgi:hypothetical protein
LSWFGNLEGVGEVSTEDSPEGSGLPSSTAGKVALSTVVFGGIVGYFTLGGVVAAWSDGYFLGRARKPGVTYKTLAKRNAALGSAMGAIAATLIMVNDGK